MTIDVILPATTKIPLGVKSLKILKDGRKQITTIVDGVGKTDAGKFVFHEVKATGKDIIKTNATDMLSAQQKFFKDVLESKIVGELIPRGEKATKIFEKDNIGKNILNSMDYQKKLSIKIKELK